MNRRIAVIEKCPSSNRYKDYFEFDFELFRLSSVKLAKVLKKDVDIEFNPDDYDYVILVGSEAAKYYAKITSVTDFAGHLVNDKFIPLVNPAMIVFKPENKPQFLASVERLHKVLEGKSLVNTSGTWLGIQDKEEALRYLDLVDAFASETGVLALDTETTALYPHDGYVLGISICAREQNAAYIDTDCVDDEVAAKFQYLFNKYKVVFHNAKFDVKMLQYHFNFKFPDLEDTLVLHYVLDETQGSHGLKSLALKYTEFGAYDSELDDFKKAYCREHGLLESEFSYERIPFSTMYPYACLTHDSHVYMEDGSLKTIGDLVRSKSTEKVLSYNFKTGSIEAKPIYGWVKQPHTSKEWFQLRIGMGSQETGTKGSLQGPKYTGDHRVYLLDRGWTEVKDIHVGDRILSQEKDLSEDSYQVLYGSLLGDGYLHARNNSGAGVTVSQAEPRKEYVAFKASMLGAHTLQVSSTKGLDNRNDMYTYSSGYSLLYTDLYNGLETRSGSYKYKLKITEDLAKKIDLRAIAIWYMDDGNLAGSQPRIWSRTLTEEEVPVILRRMEELGLKGFRYHNDGVNNQFLVCDSEHAEHFFTAISTYLHPDCYYKIPAKYHGTYSPYKWSSESSNYYYATIYEIPKWEPPLSRRGYATKWCIDVQDNANFFTKSGLVHNCKDTGVTLELYNKFKPLVTANSKLDHVYNRLLMPSLRALVDIELAGVPFDKRRLQFAQATIDKAIADATKHLYSLPEVIEFEKEQGKEFNPNSVLQLRKLLFDKLGLIPLAKKTGTGLQSTDAEVLESLDGQHEVVNSIISIRKLGKIKNTYVDNLLANLNRDLRVRTGFNLTSTTSGRLSSSGKFNAQQLPRDEKRVKGAIKGTGAYEGWKIVSQDLQTGEVYIAAVLSGDKKLQQIFIDKKDFHSSIAKEVFSLPCAVDDVKKYFKDKRQAAKAVTFSILYGAGASKVSDTVSKDSESPFTLSDAQEAIDLYFEKYSSLKKWLKSVEAEIKSKGFIYTSFGRKRRLKNVFSPDKGIAAHEIRSGTNAAVQALCSDINLLATVDMMEEIKRRKMRAEIFMLVHDSIVAIVHPDDVALYCEILAKCTQKDRGFSIPNCPIGIDQEIGDDYSFGAWDDEWKECFDDYFGENQLASVSTKS